MRNSGWGAVGGDFPVFGLLNVYLTGLQRGVTGGELLFHLLPREARLREGGSQASRRHSGADCAGGARTHACRVDTRADARAAAPSGVEKILDTAPTSACAHVVRQDLAWLFRGKALDPKKSWQEVPL